MRTAEILAQVVIQAVTIALVTCFDNDSPKSPGSVLGLPLGRWRAEHGLGNEAVETGGHECSKLQLAAAFEHFG